MPRASRPSVRLRAPAAERPPSGARPRRPRRGRAPNEPTREALVAAAYRVLAERGFEGLRTREVAAAVGVNVATLHYYFPHKQDLVRGVLGHAMARFRSTLLAEGSPAAQLRAHFQGLRALSREEPELFAAMGELMLRAARDRAIAAIVRQVDDVWHATLQKLLRGAREEGAVDPTLDPEGMAALIVAVLKGTYLLPAESAQPERLDRALREVERSLGLNGRRRARAGTRRAGSGTT